MHVAIASIDFGYAGHSRDAVAIARGLRERGHKIVFILGRESRVELLDANTFEYIYADTLDEMRHVISDEKANYDFDVVNIFSSLKMDLVAEAAFLADKPAVYTRCGGSPPHILPPIPIICPSGELYENLRQRHRLGSDYVHLVAERFDNHGTSNRLANQAVYDVDRWLDDRLGTKERGLLVVRVGRISEAYKRSIIEGMWAVRLLNERGRRSTFVHVGGGSEDSKAWAEIDRSLGEVNKGYRVPIAISIRREPCMAMPLINAADVVIGTGLTALEALYCQKPVVVVGKRGFAGEITQETIFEIAYYNFSGRNAKADVNETDSVSLLAEAIDSAATRKSNEVIVDFDGKAYAKSMSYYVGARKYENVYGKYLGESFRLGAVYRVKGRIKDRLLGHQFLRRMIWRASNSR